MSAKSDYELVKEFTEESNNVVLTGIPKSMNRDEVFWITRMVMSELDELVKTVEPDSDGFLMAALHDRDDAKTIKVNDTVDLISQQYDAFVDIYYYMLNQAAKKCVDVSKLFKVVHESNMNKRWPDGKFHKREDGKIMKPATWEEPHIREEIIDQINKNNHTDVILVDALYYDNFDDSTYQVLHLGTNNKENMVVCKLMANKSGHNTKNIGDVLVFTEADFLSKVDYDTDNLVNRFDLV